MLKIALTVVFCFLLTCASGQNAAQYLDMADKAYAAQKPDEAKALYEKAALRNSAEAHYQLAYKYILSDDERLYHLLEATKGGLEQATFDLFQEVFHHVDDFDSVSRLALKAYETGKARNPALNFVFMDENVATLKHCIDAGSQEMDLFLKKHGIALDSVSYTRPYGFWWLASEISRGQYGKPDPLLILQLACRDGFASAEKVGAVKAAYESYKAGRVLKFDPCDYVSSGYGQGFCAQWRSEEADKVFKKRIEALKKHLNSRAGQLLQDAYDKAVAFIEAKANREEGSGGTGRAAWVAISAMEQKSAWLDMIERIDSGKVPQSWSPDTTADRKLNATYRELIQRLKKYPIAEWNTPGVNDTDIVRVEQLWIPYRDAYVRLCAAIKPAIEEGKWKDWITTERTEQLKRVIEMSKSMNPQGK